MNPEYEIHEQIDRYLNGEMSESERHAFEKKLLTDDQLNQTMEAQKVANKIVIGEELLHLKRQMIQDLSTGAYNPGGTGKVWWYLTSALVATVAMVYFFMQRNSYPPAKLPDSTKQERSIGDTMRSMVIQENKLIKVEEPGNTGEVKKQPTPLKDKTNVLSSNSCPDSIIDFSCQARGACLHKEDGAIEIDVKTIKSGEAPYRFSIFSGSNFKESSVLSDLKPGKYQLYVKDSKHCIRRLNVEIEVPVVPCSNK